MRIFKTKAFHKFAVKNAILDNDLIEAITRADKGLIDAELGANIIKQRLAKQGQGRSGGFRSFIFYRLQQNHYFVAAISQNKQENISTQELIALKKLAEQYAQLTPQQIEDSVRNGYFIEVKQEA